MCSSLWGEWVKYIVSYIITTLVLFGHTNRTDGRTLEGCEGRYCVMLEVTRLWWRCKATQRLLGAYSPPPNKSELCAVVYFGIFISLPVWNFRAGNQCVLFTLNGVRQGKRSSDILAWLLLLRIVCGVTRAKVRTPIGIFIGMGSLFLFNVIVNLIEPLLSDLRSARYWWHRLRFEAVWMDYVR